MKRVVLVLVALAAAFAVLCLFADDAVERGVEAGGTLAFGTQTTLHDVDIGLLDGRVGFENLRVRNPERFSTGDALRIGRFEVQTSLPSLLTDVVEVDHIVLDGPEITLEVGKDGTNLGALLEHLDGMRPESSAGEGEEKAEAKKGQEGAGKKIHVGLVRVENARVHLKQSLFLESETTIDLPPLELADIGGAGEAKRPVSLAELFEQILGALTQAAAQAGGVPADLKKMLEGELALPALEDVRAQVETLAEDVREKGEAALEEAKEKAKGALGDIEKRQEELKKKLEKGLGGLLGGGG